MLPSIIIQESLLYCPQACKCQTRTTRESARSLKSSHRPAGSTGDTWVSHSAWGDSGTALVTRTCLSWMSEGLDPVAGLSAGSCLVNGASVSLGLLTHYATKCTKKGVKFQRERRREFHFKPNFHMMCAYLHLQCDRFQRTQNGFI